MAVIDPSPHTDLSGTSSRSHSRRYATASARGALAAILLLAALLRMGWLGTSEFKLDEAALGELALDLVQGRALPLQGTGSSRGMPSAPWSAYIYALPFAFSPDPYFAVWFTAALNILGVALCYWLGRRAWGEVPAALAALAYACSPWSVIASRKIWEPDLLAPLALLYAATALWCFVDRRPWALVPQLALLAIIPQVHFSGLALWPVGAWMLWAYRGRVQRRPALLGALVALLSFAPFLWHLGLSGGLPAFARALSTPGGPAVTDGQAARLWLTIVSGGDLHSLAGPLAFRELLSRMPLALLLPSAIGALIAASVLFLLLRRPSPPQGAAGLSRWLVPLWALAPMLLLLRHDRPLYPHYFYVALPASCLAFGAASGWLIGHARGTLRRVLLTVCVAATLIQALTVVQLIGFLGSVATPGGFGLPLAYQRQAVSVARQMGAPVLVLSPGEDPGQADWPAALHFLLRDTPHELLDGTRYALLREGPSTVLLAPGTACATEGYRLAGVRFEGRTVGARRGEAGFRVFAPRPASAPGWHVLASDLELANGVQFIGWDLRENPRPRASLSWWIAWRVLHLPEQPWRRFHIFNHLVDQDGLLIAQADGPTPRTNIWRAGDLVIQCLTLDLPERLAQAPLAMRVGMYTYPDLQNQPAVDSERRPTGDAVTIWLDQMR